MRLIDADALLEAMKKEDVLKVYECIQLVNNAPTIQREGWIGVEDRLPSAMQEVLLTNSEGYFVHGKPLFYAATGEFSCWIYTLYSQDVLDIIPEYRPTHWQPLPEPPTETE